MRKTATLASAFALTLTLAACGNDGGSGDNAGGSGDSGSGGVVAANLADLTKAIGDQTAETNSTHMTLTGDLGGQEISGEGDMQFGADAASMQMDMSFSGMDLSMVLLDDIVYLKTPQEVEPGKPWVKIDPTSDNPMAKTLGSITEQATKNADPRKAIEQFKDAGEITSTTEEDLDGKATTHYTITVDVQKLADTQTDETLKQAIQAQIDSGALQDFPVDMWVDEEGLPARFKLDMPTTDPNTGQTATVSMQIDYSDWGKPVTVEAPPADQVAELPSS